MPVLGFVALGLYKSVLPVALKGDQWLFLRLVDAAVDIALYGLGSFRFKAQVWGAYMRSSDIHSLWDPRYRQPLVCGGCSGVVGVHARVPSDGLCL